MSEEQNERDRDFLVKLDGLLAEHRDAFARAQAGIERIEEAYLASLPDGLPENMADHIFVATLVQARAALVALQGMEVPKETPLGRKGDLPPAGEGWSSQEGDGAASGEDKAE